MSAPEDVGGERDVDLRGWWHALLSRWWIAVAGLVIGALIGGVWSLSGGSTFSATTLLAPGQAFGTNGSPIQTYLTSESAINTIATSNATLEEAAAKAGVPVGQLRGHVSTAGVDLNTGSTTSASSNRNAVLVQITVQLPKKKKAEDAANAIAEIVKQTTTSKYVTASIGIINSQIANFKRRLVTEKARIDATNRALAQPNLSLDQSLLLQSAADTALANYQQTQQTLLTTQQALYQANQVEQTLIIQAARASKEVARSRRNSVLIGAVIGLLIGAIVATILGLRTSRPVAVA